MATGRIQPGSRQWVEAMRRLSGTEDTTVDMSMGRKVSRDAAIPHGMGTAALDTRLRGGGGPVYPPCGEEFNAQDPGNLPVGRDWVKVVAYEMKYYDWFNGYRPVVWVEVNSENAPILFSNSTTTAAMQNGMNDFILIPAEGGRLADTFIAMDDDGNGDVTTFCGYFPPNMAPGEVRPASFQPPVPEYDARDPAGLPVGPDWLKLNAYTRPEGETRQGPALDFLDGAPGVAPWRFVFNDGQSAGQWVGPPGRETTLLSNRTGQDIGIVTDGNGTVLARFLMDIPADMEDGERRPPLPVPEFTVQQELDGATLTLTVSGGTPPYFVDFGDRNRDEGSGPTFSNTYAFGGEFSVFVEDDDGNFWEDAVSAPPSGPLTFVSGEVTKNVFGTTTSGFGSYEGGLAPFNTTFDPPASGLDARLGRFSWVGGSVDPFVITVTDNGGASFTISVDPTTMENNETRPLQPDP